MNVQVDEISPGFGSRLRIERMRLGLSQSQLAKAADIGRLAQAKYENETTSPTVRYLAAITALGVDCQFLLFGHRQQSAALPAEDLSKIEAKAFDLLDDFEKLQPGGRLSSEARRVIFQVFRGNLVQVALGHAGAELRPADLVNIQSIPPLERTGT